VFAGQPAASEAGHIANTNVVGNCFNQVRRQLFILTILLTSCNYINTDKKRIDKAEEFKVFFYDNKEIFERLADQITNENKLINARLGQLIGPEEFDDLTKKQLRRLKIDFVTINNTNCGQLEIEFITSWTSYPIGQLYLSKDCNDDKSKKDNYWKGGFIEVWGLGDNWIIWIDSDPI
jgi:hypothetical protein